MPNAIKYSTTGDTQSLKKGNFFIGVGDVGKGPTSTTNYYNGITPSTGGYTIYLNKTSGGPSIYVASSDSQLIDFTNKIAGSSYTTAAQCLTYYSTQTDKMVLNRDYESIVTSGLTLNLDAGFTPSYPTTGTTWYDLSYSGNNGTLVNGVSYSTDGGGSMAFDGVDDYVSVLNSTSLSIVGQGLTLGAWINYNLTQQDWKGVIYKANGNSDGYQLFIDINERIAFGITTSTGFARPDSGTYLSPNTWYYIVGTYDGVNMKIYENAVLKVTLPKTGTIVNANINLQIGRSFASEEMPGKISIVQIYNRSLTSQEVLQNYNAIKSRFPSLDPDAQAFITAAAITGSTQQEAINTLVVSLKGYGIWVKMNAIYPFVGGTASQHKFNLKNPLDTDAAFRLVFNGGWTHSSTGALPNGTNAYANTYLNPLTQSLSKDSTHIAYYRRNTQTDSKVLMSAMSVGVYLIRLNLAPNYTAGFGNICEIVSQTDQQSGTAISELGLINGNRISSTQFKVFANSILKQTFSRTSTLQVNANIYISSENYGGTPGGYTNNECALASIGEGLTDTEAVNYNTAVEKFQTTLGRNSTVPVVSDADAQAFLNAAYITDTTQATAVNTLVTSLKGYGIWTKMKALYPFVGGTATTHKFNLKNPLDTDAAFRLTFNGGWTHSTTGAKPNGTNAYANTFLIPNTSLQLNSAHISFYSRTNTASWCDIGSSNASLQNGIYMLNNCPGNINYSSFFFGGSNYISPGYTRGDGFFSLRRNNSTQYVSSRNSVNTTYAFNTASKTTFPIYISSLNNGGANVDYSVRECAIASIGDGLSDIEHDNYNTAVQVFQTSLSRNV